MRPIDLHHYDIYGGRGGPFLNPHLLNVECEEIHIALRVPKQDGTGDLSVKPDLEEASISCLDLEIQGSNVRVKGLGERGKSWLVETGKVFRHLFGA